MAPQIFVNLPVKDLKKAVAFFTQLGSKFNPKFTDVNATCMIVGETLFVILPVESFFNAFTKKEICDATRQTEVLGCLSLDSCAKIDDMVAKALQQVAQFQHKQRIMVSCMGTVFRTWMDTSGNSYTWNLVQQLTIVIKRDSDD